MSKLPFRTKETWLTDGQLVLLDGFFHWHTIGLLTQLPASALQHGVFGLGYPFDLDYSHDYDEEQLNWHLHWLCEHGVLERVDRAACYLLTNAGFELWAAERNPPWERYCRLLNVKGDPAGETLYFCIESPSPEIRDDFLRLLETRLLRQRRGTGLENGLLCWRSFPLVYWGMAELEKRTVNKNLHRHFERNRTWWSTVSELLRFLPPANECDISTI